MQRALVFLMVTFVATTVATAAERFQWRGRVDGADEILIRGGTVRIHHLAAKPIQRQDYRFSSRLPARDVEVELVVVEGRGTVRLMEQPSERNDHTVVVRIEDDRAGAADYELELVWDDEDDWDDWPSRSRWEEDGDGADGAFWWEGRVDIGAEIEIRRDRHTVTDRGGQGVSERRARFETALPELPVPVSVRKLDGRGKVELVQAPSRDNDYTAIIVIEDDDNGADDYEVELRWQH